jgi:hypothetical protein
MRSPSASVPRRVRMRSAILPHRASIPVDEVTSRDGIPVTTVPRTLLDLAGVLARHRLERAMEAVEARRLTDPVTSTTPGAERNIPHRNPADR